MLRNITLSAEAGLIEKAREKAKRSRKSFYCQANLIRSLNKMLKRSWRWIFLPPGAGACI